jgi:hypothetical protein
MRRNLKDYLGATMWATDGEIGKVSDFYFDEDSWTVLYFVVEAGDWLAGRKLLISPQALSGSDWNATAIPVDLTLQKIQSSPEADTESPVSRQYEMDLYSHFHWVGYWSDGNWPGGMGTVGMITTPSLPFEEAIHQYVAHEEPSAYSIRSMKTYLGHAVNARDGFLGDLFDFIVEDGNWKITLLVIDAGKRLPEKKIAILPSLIKDSSLDNSGILLSTSIKETDESPRYPGELPDNSL